jgi:hypothetical protein
VTCPTTSSARGLPSTNAPDRSPSTVLENALQTTANEGEEGNDLLGNPNPNPNQEANIPLDPELPNQDEAGAQPDNSLV